MSESSKKQTFLHGAALLAIATAVVKVIGALYKIPLKMVIGDQGYGYYMTAYDIYSVLLMISTAGLPIAMSRMISQANSLGNYNQVRQVYKVSRTVFLILGIGSTLLMMLFSHQLAAYQKQPDAWVTILCLSPCALFMAVMSIYRGYFQGHGNMRPTSTSQMMEAVIKLVVGLGLAFVLLHYTGSVALSAGGAILGVTVSCLVSMIFLYSKFRPAYRELPNVNTKTQSNKAITKSLLAIAVPITIGSAGLQLLTVVETGVYMDQLVKLLESNRYTLPLISLLEAEVLAAEPGVSAVDLYSQVATNLKGIYNFGQTIFNMPCSFIAPITISVIPAITEHLTLNNHKQVKATEESAARITGLMSLPCTVGLLLLASPVMALLGGYEGEKLELAWKLMALLALCIFPYSIIQYTNAVLQSHGFAHVPVINMLAVGAVKLAVVYILVGNPYLGILGAPISAVLCYAGIALLNLAAIRKLVPQKPALLTNLLRPFLPASIMGAAVWLCSWGLEKLLGENISSVIACGVPIVLGVVVYVVSVAFCKAITREDCQLLPKGDKIAKLLHL